MTIFLFLPLLQFVCIFDYDLLFLQEKPDMLKDIINERIELSIATQAEIAQSVGTTPAQISLYLRGKASLNNDALENCLNELNINVETYHNRYVLAKEIACILKKENISSNEILNITRDELIEITDKKELRFLIDVSADELKDIVSSNIIDYESTYPFFRVLVSHIMNLGENPSPKISALSFDKITTQLPTLSNMLANIPVIGALAGSSIIKVGRLMEDAYKNFGKKGGFLSPLLSLTYESLKK